MAAVAPDRAAVGTALDRQVEMGRVTTLPQDRSFDWSTTARRFETMHRPVSYVARPNEWTEPVPACELAHTDALFIRSNDWPCPLSMRSTKERVSLSRRR